MMLLMGSDGRAVAQRGSFLCLERKIVEPHDTDLLFVAVRLKTEGFDGLVRFQRESQSLLLIEKRPHVFAANFQLQLVPYLGRYVQPLRRFLEAGVVEAAGILHGGAGLLGFRHEPWIVVAQPVSIPKLQTGGGHFQGGDVIIRLLGRKFSG